MNQVLGMMRCENDMVCAGTEETRKNLRSVIMNHVNQEAWWERKMKFENERVRVAES